MYMPELYEPIHILKSKVSPAPYSSFISTPWSKHGSFWFKKSKWMVTFCVNQCPHIKKCHRGLPLMWILRRPLDLSSHINPITPRYAVGCCFSSGPNHLQSNIKVGIVVLWVKQCHWKNKTNQFVFQAWHRQKSVHSLSLIKLHATLP